jgi:hypothetical protein
MINFIILISALILILGISIFFIYLSLVRNEQHPTNIMEWLAKVIYNITKYYILYNIKIIIKFELTGYSYYSDIIDILLKLKVDSINNGNAFNIEMAKVLTKVMDELKYIKRKTKQIDDDFKVDITSLKSLK